MKEKVDIFENIYKICSVINVVCKLNLEFIGSDSNNSFQLKSSKIPELLNVHILKTLTNIHNTSIKNQSIKVIHHTDNFELSYLSIGFHSNNDYIGTMILGPFLCTIPDDKIMNEIIEKNNLPFSSKLQLISYYNTLSILNTTDTNSIGILMFNLVSNQFNHCEITYSHHKINSNYENNYSDELDKLALETELRYQIEKKILNAVEKGLKDEALKYNSSFNFNPIHRVPNNPLRAYKNLALSFNTLLRVACERGGVSPIFIQSLSDKSAILIENVSTISEINSLSSNLISEYCDLVNKYSTLNYSSIVKKAINYINYNYHDKLSLSIIAKKININPSHLSRQFKKETNLTITEFINKKRINEAKFLISQNSNSITDIAFIVGFENHNYFCKVFKRITNQTPLEYFKENPTHVRLK